MPGAQKLDVPGYIDIGSRRWSCIRPTGTRRTGWRSGCRGRACWSPATTSRRSRSRCSRDGGSIAAYIATLNRLEPLVEQADHVVPGHGGPIDGTRALAILREDRAYLEALRRGEDPALPIARRSKAQRAIHAKNLTRR